MTVLTTNLVGRSLHTKNLTPPKYPNIHVQLTGQDGNAFVLIGLCTRAARRAKLPQAEIAAFTEEAMAADYDALLRTCMEWFYVT